jgi:hypothetical protein
VSSSDIGRYFGFCAPAIGFLTAASVVFLAWSSALCLSGLHRSSLQMQCFTIAVSGSADSATNAVVISRLIADGKALRGGNLTMNGRWISFWDRTLSHPGTREPASISFGAHRAVMMFDRLGNCGYLNISGPGGALWKDECGSRGGPMALDLPSRARQSGVAFPLWLAAFAALAAMVHPWTGPYRTGLWLLGFLSMVHLLFWATQPIGLLHDSLKQIPTFRTNMMGTPAYFPPGYPILIGVANLFWPALTGAAVTMLQHGMMIAAVWWCYRMLERSAGTTASFAAALAAGGAAPTLILPQGILSENVALFGMAGALYFASKYRRAAHLRDGVISGAMLGWAVLARIVPLAGGLPAIITVVSYGASAATAVRKSVTILTALLITIAAPVLWFGARSGDFALSNAAGLHLYNRVIADQGLMDPNAQAASRLLALISAAGVIGVPHWEIQATLEKRGLSQPRAEALMRQAALEGIRRSPWKYIAYSFHQAREQYFLNPDTFMPYAANPFEYPDELETPPLLGVSADTLMWRQQLEDAFTIAWRYIPWLGLAGIPLIPLLDECEIFLGLALVPAGYVVATAFVEYLLSRYNAAIVPFIVMLAGGAVAGLCRAAAAGYRSTQRAG